MKLKLVQIRGFRSIEQMNLSIGGDGHKILVGKNESGKSNILKALILLSGNISFGDKDKKELYEDKPLVAFRFNLEKDEINRVKKEFYRKFSSNTQKELAGSMTIEQLAEEYSKYIYYVVRFKGKKLWAYQPLSESLKINDNWYRLDQNYVSIWPHLEEKFSSVSFVNDDDFNKEEEIELLKAKGYLLSITLKDIFDDLCSIVNKVVIPDENYVYPVIYWEYSSKEHDLPPTINRTTFADNPDICVPLKSMFQLAKINDNSIGERINTSISDGKNQFQNLLNKVSRKTNQYINDAWKENNQVEIGLRSDGEDIVIGVKDTTNSFNFEQRSDGFRRFASFLLLINAEINKEHVHNPLILIDEPETGLHPSSAKNLKDKIIELGKENSVLYATHSISMIDTENIENNLVVSREGENTTIETVKEDGTSPAENVYHAIGYSIYENLKQNNILLEGFSDKKILKLFMTGDDWQDFGLCYTGGVKHIEYVISMLDLGNRRYVVLSDADRPAKQKKKDMGNPGYWYTYKDLGSQSVTIEDFYNEDFFSNIINEVLQENNIDSAEIEYFQEDDRINFIKSQLKNYKRENTKITTAEINEIAKDIKDKCIERFEMNNINQEKVENILVVFLEKITSDQPCN